MAMPVGFDPAVHAAAFSTAAGEVVYRASAGDREKHQLTWFDRSGTALGTMGAAEDTGLERPALSPDGRRVAVGRRVQGNLDVWILDGLRPRPLTFDASSDTSPIWSPDGQWIAFSSNRKGNFQSVQETVRRRRQRGTAPGVSVAQGTPPAGRATAVSCIPSTTIRRRATTSGRCRWRKACRDRSESF